MPGASSGIGLATTTELIRRGAQVAAVALPDPALDVVAGSVGTVPDTARLLTVGADVASSSDVDAAFDEAEAEFGDVHGALPALQVEDLPPHAAARWPAPPG